MNSFPDHTFKTKVVGITQGERQRLLSTMNPSQSVRLVKEMSETGNAKGISAYVADRQLGWLKRDIADSLLPLMKEGVEFKAWLESVVKAREGHLDCFIEIFYRGPLVSVPGLRTRGRQTKGGRIMRDYRWDLAALLFFFFCSVLAAGIGGWLTSTSVGTWYPSLAKPTWTPPNWVFGPVWTTLYAMMAVAAWLIWRTEGFNHKATCLRLYFVQLILNTVWSGFFFGLQSPILGLVEITVFWFALAATMIAFWRLSKFAGFLMAPYLAWSTYAGFLNFAIWRMNS